MNDRGLRHLGEDATGFGRAEWNTLRDSVIRPREVLEAYMTGGPDGGGAYARPLKLYLALCGILMLQLFFMGGTALFLDTLSPETLDPLIEQSGKSRDAFLAHADNWMSLFLVPMNALLYAIFSAPLLRWWDSENLGWRRAFRATFHYLNVWTIPIVPIGFLAYLPSTAVWFSLLMMVIGFVAFMRAGRGRWYTSTMGGVVKAVVITLASFLASTLASVPLMAIGLAGGVLG
ncbi:MAG: hypothetical protein U1C75_10225 [Brevundimonas sp.]|nr:hypothetical protein [Brevundimonas sp.]